MAKEKPEARGSTCRSHSNPLDQRARAPGRAVKGDVHRRNRSSPVARELSESRVSMAGLRPRSGNDNPSSAAAKTTMTSPQTADADL
jgi:hypothetical protein